jgi:Fe-S cluster biogenesis protein NfuA
VEKTYKAYVSNILKSEGCYYSAWQTSLRKEYKVLTLKWWLYLKTACATAPITQEVKKMSIHPDPAVLDKEASLRTLIEQLSAYIEQFHGGSVELVSFDGKVLKVRLGGACLGCPLLPSTLHGWVEGTVRQFFPEIERVESV